MIEPIMSDPVILNNMTPKRGPGRPRLSEDEKRLRMKKRHQKAVVTKPKNDITYKTQNQIPLIVPLLPLVWRARKMLWLLKNVELHLKKDPTFISPKEYFALLKDMENVYNQLEKEGYGTNEKRREARKGIRSKRLDQDRDEVRSSRLGESESVSVGAGVSAVNPFGGKG